MQRHGLGVTWRLAAGLLALIPLVVCELLPHRAAEEAVISGRVVDLQGQPLRDVLLVTAQRRTRSRSDGWFRLKGPQQPVLLQVQAPGFLPVLRPVLPGTPVLIRLTADDGQTLVIHAAGGVMAGRRFYAPEPGSLQPPLLRRHMRGSDHAGLLEPIQPLLASADLTVVNLETPLLADPIAEIRGMRSGRFHPSKNDVFASMPALADALQQTGVDVVGLSNDHIFDALEPGLRSTMQALHQAGFRPGAGIFGAGKTPLQAWTPAWQRLRGTWVSVLGCTTIHGSQHPWSYVTSLQQAKGGAALCEPTRLQQMIQRSLRRGPVIVMLHGGHEYQPEPTVAVTRLVALARQAGATLILNHHPHVLGGLRWDGRSLVADSLGNLLFDQTVWPTFPSLLLEVQLRRGRVLRVTGYPLLLQGFQPHLAVGELADWILAGVAFRQPGPWLLASGLLEADLDGRAVLHQRWISLPAQGKPLWQLQPGTGFCGARWAGGVELGRDLIGVGRFEPELLGNTAAAGPGALWHLAHGDQQLRADAAHQGRFGVRLRRHAVNRQAVLLRPRHRLPLQPGERISLLAWIRGSPGSRPRLQLSWYSTRRGPAQARLEQAVLLRAPQRWQPVRLDASVPAHTVAVGVAIALDPPVMGRSQLDVDELALVLWQPPARGMRLGVGWVRTMGGPVQVCLSRAEFPGVPATGAALEPVDWASPQPAKRMSRLRR